MSAYRAAGRFAANVRRASNSTGFTGCFQGARPNVSGATARASESCSQGARTPSGSRRQRSSQPFSSSTSFRRPSPLLRGPVMNAHALALRALAARYGQTMIYGALLDDRT